MRKELASALGWVRSARSAAQSWRAVAGSPDSPVAVARQVRADYLAPHYGLVPLGVVRRAAAAGLPCLLWTVNSPDLIRRYAVDPRIAAIITDVAAQAVAIVTSGTA